MLDTRGLGAVQKKHALSLFEGFVQQGHRMAFGIP